jgi:acetyl esterase/lipase
VALKAVESEYASNLAAQVLRIPFTCDPKLYPGELPERATVPIFNDTALKLMLNAFVPNVEDRKSAYVSPLLAKPELIRKLPPTYIDVDGADPLGVPGIAYGKLLEDNNVHVKVFALEGMPHGSYVLFPVLPSSRVAWASCVGGTRWALSGGK